MFFRAALAILKLSESKLLELDLESIMTYLGRFPGEGVSVLDKDVLAPLALSIKVTGGGVKSRGIWRMGGRGYRCLAWMFLRR